MSKELLQNISFPDPEAIKLTAGGAIGFWVLKHATNLFGRAFGRYIRLELQSFKEEVFKEMIPIIVAKVLEELKSKSNHDNK